MKGKNLTMLTLYPGEGRDSQSKPIRDDDAKYIQKELDRNELSAGSMRGRFSRLEDNISPNFSFLH